MSALNINNRIFIHNSDGQRVFLDPDEIHMTLHMIEHLEWEPQIREIIKASLKKGSNVVDVGANVGLHSLYAGLLIGDKGRLHCFEPNSRLFGILKDNIESNGFTERTSMYKKAVSDYTGEQTFYIYEGHASMSGFMSEHTDFDYARKEEIVEVIPLDSVDEIINNPVDLLKIDVEGYEYDVLKGADKLLDKPELTVIIEWVPRYVRERLGEEALDNTLKIFQDKGFKVYCAKFGETLVKMDFSDALKDIESCDLIFTRGNHLDSLCEKSSENSLDNDGLVTSAEKAELLHLRKAYQEAIDVQNLLKQEIEELKKPKSFFERLFGK